MSYIEKSEEIVDFLGEVKDMVNDTIKLLQKAKAEDWDDIIEEAIMNLEDLKYQL